jgi:hypothetical protein
MACFLLFNDFRKKRIIEEEQISTLTQYQNREEKLKMSDQKESHKDFSTCFEKLPFAEMMGKMMGRQGVGSICAEMMKKILADRKEGCRFDCAEMMQKIMKECRGIQEEAKKPEGEGDHERK